MGRRFKPGGFKYEPRLIVSNSKEFGKSSLNVLPAAGIEPEDPRFLAANLQHRISNAIREETLRTGANLQSLLEGFALESPGMSYDRVVRIQRGETLMQLADVLAWSARYASVRKIATEAFEERQEKQAEGV